MRVRVCGAASGGGAEVGVGAAGVDGEVELGVLAACGDEALVGVWDVEGGEGVGDEVEDDERGGGLLCAVRGSQCGRQRRGTGRRTDEGSEMSRSMMHWSWTKLTTPRSSGQMMRSLS